MKWLQWATYDLANGLGGVEVFARSLARELQRKGHDCRISRDPSDLAGDWDVILTHGSSPGARGNKKAVRVHVLHGTTLGRMAACSEWTWPGGYLAEAREIRGIAQADVVLAVNPRLSLFHFARSLKKVTAFCGNGWDASDESVAIEGIEDLEKHWLYIGRGEDIVKGADRVVRALRLEPRLHVLAAPGTGFDDFPEVQKTGVLSSAQVRYLMERARGLLLPSRYEGNSLVLLEALSLGLPVVGTQVGGLTFLPEGLQGLRILHFAEPEELLRTVRDAEREFPVDASSRAARAQANRALMPRWSDVCETALKAVEEFRRIR